tara:strand:+ start:976 stop:1821 length:846 start_codon:yes stop_codon:yes gene_type:complete
VNTFNLYNNDCFDILQDLKDNSVDMVCVDPPYGTTSIKWDNVLDFKKMWEELNRIVKPKGNVLIFGSQPFTSHVIISNIKQFRYELIWNKNKCGSPGLAKIRPQKVHENIMLFSKEGGSTYNPIMEKGDAYERVSKNPDGYGSGRNTHGYGFGNNKSTSLSNSGTRYPKSILHASRNFSAQQTVHPTQKPTNLLNWLIMTYSNPNDIVLDFTMGSGSCGVSCKLTGRSFIGVELGKEYYDIAVSRIDSVGLIAESSISPNEHQLTTQISKDMKTLPTIKIK